nr:MAG TPA: hypothetical protein [Caudoviricetes sp.]
MNDNLPNTTKIESYDSYICYCQIHENHGLKLNLPIVCAIIIDIESVLHSRTEKK